MSNPIRIQRQRTKGWKMPDNTIYVGRPSKFGNPFKTAFDFAEMHHVTQGVDAEVIIVQGDDKRIHECATLSVIKAELRGKNLACWCPIGKQCHADILLEIANS